jgi:repressor of nif and glnA expression
MTDVPNIADDIDEIVWLANAREERGLTSDEIEEELRDRGADVSSRKVQYALTDMVEAEILYRQPPGPLR